MGEHTLHRGKAASKEKLGDVVASARWVGLKFSNAFNKIMGSTGS